MAKKSFTICLLTALMLTGCADSSQPPLAIAPPNLEAPQLVNAFNPGVVAEKPKPAPATQPVVKQPDKTVLVNKPNVPSAWIPNVQANDWKWIVVHHSASSIGSAAIFDRAHRDKGWDELGYHFVIGNGTGSGDGVIEVGTRWPIQKWGAHAKTPDNRFNDFGIGICLVGNFDNSQPTAKQLAALTKLTSYLMETYHISPENVLGHGQTKATDCPGKNMPLAWVRQESALHLAEWRSTPSTPTPTASARSPIARAGDELLMPIGR